VEERIILFYNNSNFKRGLDMLMNFTLTVMFLYVSHRSLATEMMFLKIKRNHFLIQRRRNINETL